MSETGIVERLRELALMADDAKQPFFCHYASEAASLIERQQKAIDILLRAIEPFARLGMQTGCVLPDHVTPKLSIITYGDLRAARSAKEQVVRILKGEEK